MAQPKQPTDDAPTIGTIKTYENGGSLVGTVPKKVRDELGISDGDELFYRINGDKLVLEPADSFTERFSGD